MDHDHDRVGSSLPNSEILETNNEQLSLHQRLKRLSGRSPLLCELDVQLAILSSVLPAFQRNFS